MNNTVIGSRNVVLGGYNNTNTFPTLTNEANNNIIIGFGQGLAKTDGAEGGSNQLNIGGAIFGSNMTGRVNNPAGKIGILQTIPSETLHVKGTTRISNLPNNGATAAISTMPDGTASASNDQTFTATRTVVADANGVLGSVEGLPQSTVYKFVEFDAREVTNENSYETLDVIDRSAITIGALTIYFSPISYEKGHLMAKLTGKSNNETWKEEPEVRFSGYEYGGGYSPIIAYSSKPVNKYCQMTQESKAEIIVKDLSFEHENTAYIDVTLPNNKQIFRISFSSTAHKGSFSGDGSATVVLGLQRLY